MARKNDPLAAWKARVQPTAQAEATFRAVRAMLEKCPGDALTGQVQEFPPKYVLTVSARARQRRGQVFATVAAVADSVYFDLVPDDPVLHRQLRRLFRGSDYIAGDGFELTGDQSPRFSRIEALVIEACADLGGKVASGQTSPIRPKPGRTVPPIGGWSSTVAWAGPDVEPVRRAERLGRDTVFARCTVAVHLGRTTGVGVKDVRERETKGLLEFEPAGGRAKRAVPRIVAAHWRGFDRRSWSVRLVRQGKREFMPLFVGETFAEQREAPAELLERWPMERVELIAAIPWDDGTFVRLALGEAFEVLPDDDDEEATDDDL